jgi:N-acetylneuraminic acid mutarotase
MKKLTIVLIPILIYSLGCKKDQNGEDNLPVASFTISAEISRPAETINFQNTSQNATTFEWDFGDGNTSSAENPSHIYNETGTYTIKLKVTNTDGTDEAFNSLEITYWAKGVPMPTGRWTHSTCVVDGIIYAIGGGLRYGQGALGTVEAYDPITNTWTTKSEMPTARQAPAASVVNGKIYVIGGGESPSATNYNGAEVFNTVEEYDPVTDTWSAKSPMSTARWSHSASVINDKIYIIGGAEADCYPFDIGCAITSIETYDPAKDTWSVVNGATPRPMMNHSAVVLDEKIYIIGGELAGYSNNVNVYDPQTNTWEQKNDMTSGKSDFSTVVLNDKIITIGGDLGDVSTIIGDMQIYDPNNDTWTTTNTPLITPRVGLQSCLVDGKIYAIGGLLNWGASGSSSVEVYYE